MSLRFPLLLLFLLAFVAPNKAAVYVTPAPLEVAATQLTDLDPAQLTRPVLEKKLGRKLKFKERLGLSLLRGKVKRAKKRAAKGKTAKPEMGRDWMPVAALVLLCLSWIIPFGLMLSIIFSAVSLKRNRYVDPPRYRMAKTVLIIGASLIVLTLILVFVVLSTTFGA